MGDRLGTPGAAGIGSHNGSGSIQASTLVVVKPRSPSQISLKGRRRLFILAMMFVLFCVHMPILSLLCAVTIAIVAVLHDW